MGKKKIRWDWDRAPGETARQYQLFMAYREQRTPDNPVAKRNLRQLAEEHKLSHDYLLRLSADHAWLARADAYDDYIDEKATEAAIRERIKMKAEHAKIGRAMVIAGAKKLSTISVEEMSPGDIARLVDIGVKVERLARGEATEKVEASGETGQSIAIRIINDIPKEATPAPAAYIEAETAGENGEAEA